MMPLGRSVSGLLIALALAGPAFGQGAAPAGKVVFPGESVQARNRLQTIDQLLEPSLSPYIVAGCMGRLGLIASPLDAPFALASTISERPFDLWEQAAEAYEFLLNDSGDALVTLPAGPDVASSARTSIQVRRLCHFRLAALPTSALAPYRERLAAESRRLLALGRKKGDSAPLRQLVDQMVCCGCGEEALDLLGDLAFERGDFDEARHWWRQLAALPADEATSGAGSLLRFPGANVETARVEAKQILALAFQGRLTQAQEELARFHRRYPHARGILGGKDDFYSTTVQGAMRGVVKAGLANNADPWTTFGGSDTRNHVLTVCPPARLWEDGPTWQIPLPTLDPPKKGKNRHHDALERHGATRSAVFHPVIVDQQVLLADARSVTSYHLQSGKRLFHYDLKSAGLSEGNGSDRNLATPRFTFSADRGRAYVRLGRQWLAPARDGDPHEPSYLVCLDLAEPGNTARQRELWHVKTQADEFFEGSPLVRGGRTYIAMSRTVGKRVVTAIQCYDAWGRLRWSRDVCDCPEFEDNAAARSRQHLLTWAGGQLVYCTHTGAIVAVDPWNGRTLWAVRYPSHPAAPDGEPSPRDLAPCVADDGRVFVAPLDCDRLYCLDTFTGQVLWERDGFAVVQLLGATCGRVFLTTPQGVHAVSAATGLTIWQQPSEGRLAGRGRGLIAGGWLFWPTQDDRLPMRALTLVDGRQQKGDEESPFAEPSFFDPTQLRLIPAGNLAFGHGCLIVAGIDTLVVFVPADRLPPLPAAPETRPHAGFFRWWQDFTRAAAIGRID